MRCTATASLYGYIYGAPRHECRSRSWDRSDQGLQICDKNTNVSSGLTDHRAPETPQMFAVCTAFMRVTGGVRPQCG